MQKIMKGSLQRKLKGASVWPFNARSRSAYKLKSTVSPRTGLIFIIIIIIIIIITHPHYYLQAKAILLILVLVFTLFPCC